MWPHECIRIFPPPQTPIAHAHKQDMYEMYDRYKSQLKKNNKKGREIKQKNIKFIYSARI